MTRTATSCTRWSCSVTGGRRQFDTDTIIKRYELRIAQSVLADMILIGHEAVGSYALSQQQNQSVCHSTRRLP